MMKKWVEYFVGRRAREKRLDRWCVILGEEFRRVREEAGVSQEELAARSGVPLFAVQDFESAGHVSIDDMQACCDVLGYEPSRLFDVVDDARRAEGAL